jgi:tetratricopeptide (TPR) repeat protein
MRLRIKRRCVFPWSGRTVAILAAAAVLVVATTSGADPRMNHVRSSSITTLWFDRTAPVADAVAAWERGQTDTAVELALGALEHGNLHWRDRQDAAAVVCMGRTLQDRAARAIPYCEQALQNRGDHDWRHVNNLANAQLQAGLFEAAIANYERAIRLVSTSHRGLRGDYERERERMIAEVLQPNLELAERRSLRAVRRTAEREGAPEADSRDEGVMRLAESAAR